MTAIFDKFLDRMLTIRDNITDEHIKTFCAGAYGIPNTKKRTLTGYMSIDILRTAYEITEKLKYSINSRAIKSHDIYSNDLFKYGYLISKKMPKKYDGLTYVRVQDLCAALCAIYHNSYDLNNTDYNMPIEQIYLALCLGVYEFDNFENKYSEEFAMIDTDVLKVEDSSMIKALQNKYISTTDRKYVYMINIILRADSYSLRNHIREIQNHYQVVDKSISDNKFKYLSYITSLTPELSKTTTNKIHDKIEQAYYLIADITATTYSYEAILSGCEDLFQKREIALNVVHSRVAPAVKHGWMMCNMEVIHMAHLKKLAQMRMFMINGNYTYIN